jgi:uncharacterized membrane protein
MIPVAFGVAVVATLLLLLRTVRVYPSAPKRVPINIRADGRPSQRTTGKIVLWLAPSIVVAVLLLLGVLSVVQPPRESERSVVALVFVIVAEVAWYVAWTTDRQIEMARKMTFRIAPARMLRALLPLLLTVAVTIFIAARV